jgi:hypothetical protein
MIDIKDEKIGKEENKSEKKMKKKKMYFDKNEEKSWRPF